MTLVTVLCRVVGDVGVYNDPTVGFVATARDDKEKRRLRKWAKAFDDANMGLRLQDNTHVYYLSPTDHVLVVSGDLWVYVHISGDSSCAFVCAKPHLYAYYTGVEGERAAGKGKGKAAAGKAKGQAAAGTGKGKKKAKGQAAAGTGNANRNKDQKKRKALSAPVRACGFSRSCVCALTYVDVLCACTQKGRKRKQQKQRLLRLIAEFAKALSDSDSEVDDEDSDDDSDNDPDGGDNLEGANELVKQALSTNTNRAGATSVFRKYLAKAKKLHPEYKKGIDEALSVFKCNSSGPAKEKLRALIGVEKE